MNRTHARAVGRLVLGLAVSTVSLALADDIPRPEHPCPDAVREHWANLNGKWEFRFDAMDVGQKEAWFQPGAEGFDRTIVVPFPWESELSGIHKPTGAPKVGWYRRTFQVPDDFPRDQHVWLRFGAVDWHADVWVNGTHVAEHDGGYTPFEADITDTLKRDGENVVVVRAFDPTDPSLPTGKQVNWYTTTSGIWQTVWLEARPEAYIGRFTITTEIHPPRATILAGVLSRGNGGLHTLTVRSDDPTVASGLGKSSVATNNSGIVAEMIRAEVDVREPKLWTPDSPHLYDVTLELKDADGKVIDTVKTYFGLRTIARGKVGDEPFERVLLNGKPIYLRGALDQSFNPKGIYTAPSDEFLKRDIELARSFGTNFLRIHIKPDEPRRLYWADRLGMLIMQDMPNTWQQNERARKAWEATMRETVARDRNHPAIFAWVDFNETWGLGSPPQYKADKDTQQWVKSMVALTRELDPTRLVEDNSPCNYDHVSGTDLNSWHFYIDDHETARQHIENVVAQSEPGSAFNYCPDEKMNSAPLINSEYGAVSAGGGDRDISWGFRDLTTQLRKYPKIQGYIYTELTDIEWEHNGFANYDRSPKTFGYDAFVPGMTVADLQGPDFVGYDGPPAIVAKVGETIGVPLFVSHYSDRVEPPVLKWWITGVNEEGETTRIAPRERPVEWEPYGVKAQKRIAFKIHEPFVGAVALTLEDKDGHRIAANFVNIVVKPETPLPRVERLGDHEVALRFSPADIASARWSGGFDTTNGKVSGRGQGSFVYHLKVPKAVALSHPTGFRLRFEVASKAAREKVDWPERVNPQDYPQTDAKTWPSSLLIRLNGARVIGVSLRDDPADARGVLSHLAKRDHGSYGQLIDTGHPLPNSAKADIAAGEPLILRLSVPDEGETAGGLAIYSAETGAYPCDPTLILETDDELPQDLGVDPNAPVAIETLASRRVAILAPGDSGRDHATNWAYTTKDPGDGWSKSDFDDRSWSRGPAGFGTPGTPAVRIATPWNTDRIWLRATVDLPKIGPDDALTLHLFHDEDVEIFVNGERLYRARGYLTSYQDLPLEPSQKALFHPGRNVIAVTCKQTGGGQGVDVGLGMLKSK